MFSFTPGCKMSLRLYGEIPANIHIESLRFYSVSLRLGILYIFFQPHFFSMYGEYHFQIRNFAEIFFI